MVRWLVIIMLVTSCDRRSPIARAAERTDVTPTPSWDAAIAVSSEPDAAPPDAASTRTSARSLDAGTPIASAPPPPPPPPPSRSLSPVTRLAPVTPITIERSCTTTTKTPRELKRVSGKTVPAARTIFLSCESLSFANPSAESEAYKRPVETLVVNSAGEYKKITGCAPPAEVDFSRVRLVLFQFVTFSSTDRRFNVAVQSGSSIHLVFDETHTCQGTRSYAMWTTRAVVLPRGKERLDTIVCNEPSTDACRAP